VATSKFFEPQYFVADDSLKFSTVCDSNRQSCSSTAKWKMPPMGPSCSRVSAMSRSVSARVWTPRVLTTTFTPIRRQKCMQRA
jgi:hypothetical protein